VKGKHAAILRSGQVTWWSAPAYEHQKVSPAEADEEVRGDSGFYWRRACWDLCSQMDPVSSCLLNLSITNLISGSQEKGLAKQRACKLELYLLLIRLSKGIFLFIFSSKVSKEF
jgi:hypothetical protein